MLAAEVLSQVVDFDRFDSSLGGVFELLEDLGRYFGGLEVGV